MGFRKQVSHERFCCFRRNRVGSRLVVGLMFGLSAVGLVHYQFFAPKFQAVEREVYENTPSYIQGKEQSLSELRLEYQKAKTAGERTKHSLYDRNERPRLM